MGSRIGLAVLVAGLALGCASNGDLAQLESRVSDLSTRIDAVEAQAKAANDRAAAAERQAGAAAERAESAAKQAASAAERADRAERTSEAIFKKTVRK
jgi:outer membrane murein-binding lipoprotein Lpp